MLAVACSKDDDGSSNDSNNTGSNYTGPNCESTWVSEIQDELDEVSQATQDYASDPSASNCSKLKGALNDYIDELERYSACPSLTGSQRAQYEQSLQDARDDLDGTC